MRDAGRTAILLGSSGLIGKCLLQYLLESALYDKVIVFVRKSLNLSHFKLTEIVIDFNEPSLYKDLVVGDDIFCCLGTTISKAGSQEAFRQVDYVYVTQFAQIAKDNGIKQFLLVSSIGANPYSHIFYLKTKGECEAEVSKTGFDSVSIFRPASLVGDRDEFRMNEKIMLPILKTFSFLLVGKMRKYRPIKASKVANAMLRIATRNTSGINVYESDVIMSI